MVRPSLGAWTSPTPPLTRFAPSPTGYLHLGHVVNAVYVWGVAKALGGHVHLRIEDHDRIRSRPEYERAILEDLEWLGFVPDSGHDPLDRQSHRPDVYEAALRQLAAHHHVYGCHCSRRLIGGERYGGHCRFLDVPLESGAGVRVVIDPALEQVDDLLMGPLAQDPSAQSGDLLLRDRDGLWTYQFAVTVDDLNQAVTLVIRGADLADSTGRQVRLARMLGRSRPPLFLHHPLLLSARGEKLSKSARDTGVRELRAAGLSPAAVIGMAAAAVGLAPAGTALEAASVAHLFK